MNIRKLVYFFILSGFLLLSVKGYCESAEDHVQKGISCHNDGKFDDAIAEYDRAIEIDPASYRAYNFRGIAYAAKDKNNLDVGLADLSKAIEIYPQYFEGYYNRARAYMYKNDLDSMISDLTTAIEIKQDFIEAYNLRAGACLQKGIYDKAWDDVYRIKSFGRKIDPAFFEALKKASGREK